MLAAVQIVLWCWGGVIDPPAHTFLRENKYREKGWRYEGLSDSLIVPVSFHLNREMQNQLT